MPHTTGGTGSPSPGKVCPFLTWVAGFRLAPSLQKPPLRPCLWDPGEVQGGRSSQLGLRGRGHESPKPPPLCHERLAGPEMALRSAAGPAVALSQLPRPAVEPAEDAPIPRGASALLAVLLPGGLSRGSFQHLPPGGSPGSPSREQALVRSAVYGSSWVQLDRGGWEGLERLRDWSSTRLWGRNWTSIRTQQLTGWASSQRGGWLSE